MLCILPAADMVKTQKFHPLEWVDYSDPAYKEMPSKFENPTQREKEAVKKLIEGNGPKSLAPN